VYFDLSPRGTFISWVARQNASRQTLDCAKGSSLSPQLRRAGRNDPRH
jgi:hypothetical protein